MDMKVTLVLLKGNKVKKFGAGESQLTLSERPVISGTSVFLYRDLNGVKLPRGGSLVLCVHLAQQSVYKTHTHASWVMLELKSKLKMVLCWFLSDLENS